MNDDDAHESTGDSDSDLAKVGEATALAPAVRTSPETRTSKVPPRMSWSLDTRTARTVSVTALSCVYRNQGSAHGQDANPPLPGGTGGSFRGYLRAGTRVTYPPARLEGAPCRFICLPFVCSLADFVRADTAYRVRSKAYTPRLDNARMWHAHRSVWVYGVLCSLLTGGTIVDGSSQPHLAGALGMVITRLLFPFRQTQS